MLLRRVARPLLAAMFVSSGIDQLLNPEAKIQAATPLIEKGQQVLPTTRSAEPSTVVQADAAVKIGAGLLLALGRTPRVAALALAASLIPTTVVEHPFWSVHGNVRAAERTQFLKNAGMLGGLMLAAADTQGKPSLVWRARRAQRDAARAARITRRRARGAKRDAARAARITRKSASARARSQVAGLASKAVEAAPSLR